MAGRSKKWIHEVLSSNKEFISFNHKEAELDRKIALATECFTTQKYCELLLRDRNRLSEDNALTVANYIIDYKQEVNAKAHSIQIAIQVLSGLSRAVGLDKKFADITRNDILCHLNNGRKSEAEDPMHKWIGTYTVRRQTLLRFFKWLHYPEIGDPKERDKLSAANNEPKCIQDIPWLKRKELSCYKPTDMWTPEDDLVFVRYVTNKRDRCYQMMSRDTSARPHELLALKIKDIVFKLAPDGKHQYAIVLLNGKTGPRSVPLIQSIQYVKAWLEDHPRKNIPNSYLFVSLSNQSNGNNYTSPLTREGLYGIYDEYKKVLFPKLLKDPQVPYEDKEKIKDLLVKPWNPYVRRHSGATEKCNMLKDASFKQYGGWSPKSFMPQRYTHLSENESSKILLQEYGIDTKNSGLIDVLSPKTCPNCNEPNTIDAKFCAKCKLVLTYDAYNETLRQEREKEIEIAELKNKIQELTQGTDQIKELQRQIAEINQKLGIDTPFDLSPEIELYKERNRVLDAHKETFEKVKKSESYKKEVAEIDDLFDRLKADTTNPQLIAQVRSKIDEISHMNDQTTKQILELEENKKLG